MKIQAITENVELFTGGDCAEICRICLESGPIQLINPCNCSGTTKFVHETCLKAWITLKFPNVLDGRCEICKSSFHMSISMKRECKPRKATGHKFSYLCSIPILFFIVTSAIVYFGIYIANSYDIENEKATSIATLVICISLITFGSFFLIKGFYKVFTVPVISLWTINSFSLIRPTESQL